MDLINVPSLKSQVNLYIVMGTCGCGKSSVGQKLAESLKAPFIEGDHFHPKVNIDKMANGIPLTDDDRWPWLSAIRAHCQSLAEQIKSSNLLTTSHLVVTCSALKKSYRDHLRNIKGIDRIIFVYLKGSFELIYSRISQRNDHYMKPLMLKSQFDTLESPEGEDEVIVVNIDQSLSSMIEQIISEPF